MTGAAASATQRPTRIQRQRTPGWKTPPNTVYVGRPTKWGNPFDFRRAEYCWAALSLGCRADRADRQEAAVRAYRHWIIAPPGKRTKSMWRQPKLVGAAGELKLGPRVAAGLAPSLVDIRAELGGRHLMCWCRLADPCHADILLEIANG